MISAVDILRAKTANAFGAAQISRGGDPRYPQTRAYPAQILGSGVSKGPGGGPGGVTSGFQPLSDFAAK